MRSCKQAIKINKQVCGTVRRFIQELVSRRRHYIRKLFIVA